MVKMAKNANFWTNGLFYVIFFPTLSVELNCDIEIGLAWFGGYAMVKIAKTANFLTNGLF